MSAAKIAARRGSSVCSCCGGTVHPCRRGIVRRKGAGFKDLIAAYLVLPKGQKMAQDCQSTATRHLRDEARYAGPYRGADSAPSSLGRPHPDNGERVGRLPKAG